jgi:hypothetical protein
LHEISELYLQRRFVLKLLAILADYIGTASQTARGVPGSATRFEVASNIARVVNAKVEIGTVLVSVLGLSMKQIEIGRQHQKKKQATDLKSIDSTSHETPC